MSIDREFLAELMAAFENGQDDALGHTNPFTEFPDGETLNMVTVFVEGNAVPETSKWVEQLNIAPGDDAAVAYAIAGFLQGLAIGFGYSQREPW